MDAVPSFLPRLDCRVLVRPCHSRLYFLAPEEAPDPVLDWLEPEVPLEKPEPPDVCEEDHLSPADWARAAKPPELMSPPPLACYHFVRSDWKLLNIIGVYD